MSARLASPNRLRQSSESGGSGSGFRVQGAGFRVQGAGSYAVAKRSRELSEDVVRDVEHPHARELPDFERQLHDSVR